MKFQLRGPSTVDLALRQVTVLGFEADDGGSVCCAVSYGLLKPQTKVHYVSRLLPVGGYCRNSVFVSGLGLSCPLEAGILGRQLGFVRHHFV